MSTHTADAIPRAGEGTLATPQPAFDAPNLAAALDAMSVEAIDELPFGVIGLDPHDKVRTYNRTEARLSGYKSRPAVGRTFFVDVAPCMNNGYFKGRIDQARQRGTLDVRFSFIGDFNDRQRELIVRALAAKDGGIWICHLRADGTH